MLQFKLDTGFENLSPEHYAIKLAHQESRRLSAVQVESHVRGNSGREESADYVQSVWNLYDSYENRLASN